MLKKIILGLFILQILLSNLLYVSAKDAVMVNSNFINAQQDGSLSDEVVINYDDITAQNAGKIIKIWKGKSNFASKFVLTGGVDLKIDQSKLDKKNQEINNLKTKLENLEKISDNSGKLIIEEPEMIQYPDRITIKVNYSIEFQNLMEFNNYKRNFNKLNKKTITDNEKLNKTSKGIKELIKECELEGYCKTVSETNIMKGKLINAIVNGKKIISLSEQINYNLIPLDITNLNEVNSPTFNLNIDPKDVRIRKSTIVERFNKIKLLNESVTSVNDIQLNGSGVDLDKTFVKKASANSSSSVNNNSTPQDYCSYYYMPEEPEYSDCIGVKSRMDAMTTSESSKLMLNGFTIGNSWSEDFNKIVSVPKPRKPWENTTIFRARANRTFSYGVGLRIPFLVQTSIRDRGIPTTSTLRYGAKVDTVDMTANQYRQLGLPNEHIFGGKEFVLELKASIFAKVVLFGEDLVNHTWGLGDLLPRDTPGRVSDGIDLGRNFKPPFGDQERVGLTDVTIPIPVVDIDVASVKINMIVKSYIEGIMKAQIDLTNFSENTQNVTFDNTNYKYFNFNPVYSPNPEVYHTVIGDVGKGIISLNSFDYRPRLTFQLQAEPVLEVWIPGRGHEDWSFGTYDIYSFQVDPGVGLTRHRGTSGSINTNNIFIYRMNTEMSATKIADNARKARMERNREIASNASSSRGFSADDFDLQVDGYGNPRSSSSSSSSSRSSGPGRIQDEEGMENLGLIDRAREQARGGNSGSSSSSLSSIGLNYGINYISGNILQLNMSGINLIGGNTFSIGTGYYMISNMSGSKYISNDVFVNEKLAEINSGFVEVYNDYLNTINDYIKRLNDGITSATDISTKNKYQNVLNKLNEIKELFLARYSFLIKYSKGLYIPEILVINTDSLKEKNTQTQGGSQISQIQGLTTNNTTFGGTGNNQNNDKTQAPSYNEVKFLKTKMSACPQYDIKIGNLTWAGCNLKKPMSEGYNEAMKEFLTQSEAQTLCSTGYRLPTTNEIETMLSKDISQEDQKKYGILSSYKINKVQGYIKLLGFTNAGHLQEAQIEGRETMSILKRGLILKGDSNLLLFNGIVYKINRNVSKYRTIDNKKVFNISQTNTGSNFSDNAGSTIRGFARCVKK